MPTFQFKDNKTGQVHTINAPEGATADDAYAFLQQSLGQQGQSVNQPAPAPAPVSAQKPAAPAPTPKPAPTPQPAPAKAPTAAAAPAKPPAPSSGPTFMGISADDLKNAADKLAGFTGLGVLGLTPQGQGLLAGAAENLRSKYQGAKQYFNTITGNEQANKELAAAVKADQPRHEAEMAKPWAKAGDIGMDVGLAAMAPARAIPQIIISAVQSGLNYAPTVKDQLVNAALGAGLAGLTSGVGRMFTPKIRADLSPEAQANATEILRNVTGSAGPKMPVAVSQVTESMPAKVLDALSGTVQDIRPAQQKAMMGKALREAGSDANAWVGSTVDDIKSAFKSGYDSIYQGKKIPLDSGQLQQVADLVPEIGDVSNLSNVKLSGPAVQQAISRAKQMARQVGDKPAEAKKYYDIARNLEDSARTVMSDAEKESLTNLNSQNFAFNRIKDANPNLFTGNMDIGSLANVSRRVKNRGYTVSSDRAIDELAKFDQALKDSKNGPYSGLISRLGNIGLGSGIGAGVGAYSSGGDVGDIGLGTLAGAGAGLLGGRYLGRELSKALAKNAIRGGTGPGGRALSSALRGGLSSSLTDYGYQ